MRGVLTSCDTLHGSAQSSSYIQAWGMSKRLKTSMFQKIGYSKSGTRTSSMEATPVNKSMKQWSFLTTMTLWLKVKRKAYECYSYKAWVPVPWSRKVSIFTKMWKDEKENYNDHSKRTLIDNLTWPIKYIKIQPTIVSENSCTDRESPWHTGMWAFACKESIYMRAFQKHSIACCRMPKLRQRLFRSRYRLRFLMCHSPMQALSELKNWNASPYSAHSRPDWEKFSGSSQATILCTMEWQHTMLVAPKTSIVREVHNKKRE